MAVFSRKERDRQLRRSDIFAAAEHIFALKGYHKATIRDIAKEAQYAIGTVYLHFKDKDALYLSLFTEKLKIMLSIVEEKMSSAKDAKSKLETFVRESLVFFEDNLDFFRIFVSEADDMMIAEKGLRSTPAGQKFERCMADIVKQAQKEGIISRDFEPMQVLDILTAIMKSFVLKWFKEYEKGKKSLSGMSDIILKCLLNGISGK
ncbi:MAG TPA: TetR/AcrR family transcriptional regulator [Candidatus Omnitrophota bacterium]|nr:TetR/AcrR family transcriptional regulator [Candidatus Omnitrophota bacterium]HRZ67703.1 TetR/AcrR family transcriptional regulator [Candidatus Omnitrophota bacterium]